MCDVTCPWCRPGGFDEKHLLCAKVDTWTNLLGLDACMWPLDQSAYRRARNRRTRDAEQNQMTLDLYNVSES